MKTREIEPNEYVIYNEGSEVMQHVSVIPQSPSKSELLVTDTQVSLIQTLSGELCNLHSYDSCKKSICISHINFFFQKVIFES